MFDGIEVQRNTLLAPYTTLRIGGPTDYLAFPKNQEELFLLMKEARNIGMPTHFLGGGSNLLIHDDGVRGLVIHLSGDFNKLEVSSDGCKVSVGAAYSFPKLTRRALELGWETALGWGGVPGGVGGALKMNAGTPLGELGEVVSHVEAVTPAGPLVLQHVDMCFSYRNTQFPENAVLCKVYLKCLSPRPERRTDLLHQALLLAKKRKQTQPKKRSAGSMFKNPKGDFAGRLIEACGLKGKQIGGACVSEVHANFLLNYEKASAEDMFKLSELVRKTVYDKFGVKLEYEVRRWGF